MHPGGASFQWYCLLCDVLLHEGSPHIVHHDVVTNEILNNKIKIDMRYPVVWFPDRRLSVEYMAAEAHWILKGDNRVETIAPYNKNISKYSDNGTTFFGAYGPPIMDQILYVVTALQQDRGTRQAGLTIWKQNPPVSKDIPCTISMFFNIRKDKLHASVHMRSSDSWLGLPYDIFTFSMVAYYVCCLLNEWLYGNKLRGVEPGNLTITMVSSHLYNRDFKKVATLIDEYKSNMWPTDNPLPDMLYLNRSNLMKWLDDLKKNPQKPMLRHWTV